MRLPEHIGIIPDGNRRWAEGKGLAREVGYQEGLDPGLRLFRQCKQLGIKELTYYGFTMDNTKRPAGQTRAFTRACIEAVMLLSTEDAELLVVGNTGSAKFPGELLCYTGRRKVLGKGGIRVNFLVNYGWQWDLSNLIALKKEKKGLLKHLHSNDISRVDLIIRWGGRRRLSGFLPVQSIYADFYIIDDYWPDFKEEHLFQALEWYNTQDLTYGG